MRIARVLAALLSAVLCASAAGCAPDRGSGTVSVLCSNDADICDQWARDFTGATGVDVTMVRMPTSEALTRIEHSGDDPEFDIWHGGPAEFYVRAASEGLLEAYDPPGTAEIPEDLKDPSHLWTGVYASVLAICSDTRHLAQLGAPVPRTWEDLLAPELRGMVVTSSPRTSGTAYTLMFTQYQRLGTVGAEDYLGRLYAQVQQFTRSGTAPARTVASGEAAVAITFAPYCSSGVQGTAHLEVTYPSDGTGFEVGAVALLRGAPHAVLARRYVDYAVSDAAQSACRRVGIHQLPTDTRLPDDITGLLEDPDSDLFPSDIHIRNLMRDPLIGWFTQEGFDA